MFGNEALERRSNLSQLELVVRKKIDGLLHGDHLALRHGPGFERGEGRNYLPGDDARLIDWHATARTNEVQVRETIAERELQTWLFVDTSPSMFFGTQKWEKVQLATTMAAAFGLVGVRAADRVGAQIFDGQTNTFIRPAAGARSVLGIVRRLEEQTAAAEGDVTLAGSLRTLARTARRPGRIVVISDFGEGVDWGEPLRPLATKHDVVAVHISDPREWELPKTGLMTFVDPETGEWIEVQSDNARFRQDYAALGQRRRAEIHNTILGAGARYLDISTARNWLLDLVRFGRQTKVAL